MEYICHSGGCPGADMTWETECEKYGIKTISYSFWNHVQEGKNPKILSPDELAEGFEQVKLASTKLNLPVDHLMNYQKNLLSRNWFQVKNSDKIFAIGTFKNDTRTLIDGGTGWAVQMAINNKKPVYFFDQLLNRWHFYWYTGLLKFAWCSDVPSLPHNFAGIGTRNINENGIKAIKQIVEYNLKTS